ncbi:A/G-specific adenine glycosylase [Cellulomonas cellasea]|uniref:A/G-specific adenine glycosylase n=1 Tax=Cellulomonas cellasea TaxID=43670 RepID=UPI0025A32E58|nr:A/G-specific adenine glycosylase [Cellulomonas cellasea]MDM8084791.1 A/G-specific adenine glycosylase [Cellulomonas cellasea]
MPAPDAEPLRAAVLDWFGRHARDLPWRSADCSAWGVLVSEVMLQQTPVVRVEPAWRAWMARWPEPADLAAASPADVLRAWDRLGYPRRALRLQECARAVVERHGGVVPAGAAELLALPGVGPYTAAAVQAFAFGRRSVVLDTNVRRVLARAVQGAALPAPSQTAAEVRLAEALVPADDATAARWSAASMELGALVCTARSPRCEECPIAGMCAWRAAGRPVDEHAGRRRTQAWAGTDRQVRGKVMALLREALGPVPAEAVEAVWPERAQLERCVESLLVDGLMVRVPGADDDQPPVYRLP